jgi:hypothetical protein
LLMVLALAGDSTMTTFMESLVFCSGRPTSGQTYRAFATGGRMRAGQPSGRGIGGAADEHVPLIEWRGTWLMPGALSNSTGNPEFVHCPRMQNGRCTIFG